MTALPPNLSPWAEPLGVFPEELALSIGPWLPRLALAFGRLFGSDRAEGAEPDGLHGLCRRGPIERLSLGEWLLAQEEPLELERRLAMGEALYLELAKKEPAGDRRSVVLFDAGPSQLGPPRILHLASLIVLAARAAEAKAGLLFGVLQAPTASALTVINERTVLRLLEGRSAREANGDDWARWRDAHALGKVKAADDLWLIGGRRITSIPAEAAKGVVEERFDTHPRRLSFEIDRRGQKRSVELECPPDHQSTRLLRNPFEVTRSPPQPARDGFLGPAPLLLSPSGRQLWVKTRAGVLVYRVDAGDTGPPRHLSGRDQLVLALGESKNQVSMLTSDGERLTLIRYGRYGRFDSIDVLEIPSGAPITHPTRAAPIGDIFLHRGELAFLDAAGRLLRVSLSLPPTLALDRPSVASLCKVGDALSMLVAGTEANPGAAMITMLSRGTFQERKLIARSPLECFSAGDRRSPLHAYRVSEGLWHRLRPGDRKIDEVRVDPADRVVGLSSFGLVSLGAEGRLTIYGAGAPIIRQVRPGATAFSVRGQRIAYLLADRSIDVIDPWNNRVVLRVRPEGGP